MTTETTHRYAGSDPDRQQEGDPGHCNDCVARGHVAAHPNLGCSDVGCDEAHPDDTGTVKLKFDLSTGLHGAKVWDIYDTGLSVADWDAMTPEQRTEYADREYRDWMLEQCEGGWEIAK
ncbi:hypothetical protein AB0G05_26815 [Nonomuraea wenchangensis]